MNVRIVPFLAIFVLGSLSRAADTPAPAAPPVDPSKAEGRFKNIQVLKGTAADDVVPAMQFISASLGVDCDFCHVQRQMDKDDKQEKLTARKMITMTLAINRDNFDGHREVTCMSCHHGASHPATIPTISLADREPEAPEVKREDLPQPAPVLDKYLQAVGGAEAIAKVKSRVQKGKLSGFGPEAVPVDVSLKSGGKRITTVHNPNGDNITAVDTQGGWLGGGNRPPRDMTAAESDAARLDAMILTPSDPKSLFKNFKPIPGDTLDGKPVVRVLGLNEGKPPVELWFDVGTGLLVRMVRYAETPLGRNPTQIDYADYRDSDGVKIPYRWTVARPSGHFTIQVDESHQNVPVDDAAFQKAAAGAPPS